MTNTSAMRTVLVFAHECAPYNRPESTIGAQRPAQFARYLPEFGWRAIVICRDHGAKRTLSADEVADCVERRLREASPNASVIIPLPAPTSPDWLDRLWDVTASGRARRLLAIPRKALTLSRFFVGDYSRAWRPIAQDAARRLRALISIDLCLGEHSPDAGLFLARWYARETGVPWVMDFRDPILFGYPSRVRPLLIPFARRALAGVSRIVTVTPACQDIDRQMFDVPVELITNGFDPEDFETMEPYRGNEALTIAYTGGVWVESALQTFLEGFARAVRQLEPGTLLFRYRGPSRDLVHRLASAAGVTNACDIGSQIPRAQALAVTAAADLLLLFAPGDHPDPYWRRGVYPGKTFEYFGARRPILCVPGDRGILDDLLARTQTGTVARNAREVESSLVSTWSVWRSSGVLSTSPNESVLRRYSRRATVEQLAGVLDAVVRSPGSARVSVMAEAAPPAFDTVPG